MDSMVPEERRAKLATIKERLSTLSGSTARALWEYGALFREVRDLELWREDGRESFVAWVEEVAGYSRETARRAILVAQHFNVEMAERFGIDKLTAALRYMELTRQEERPGDILALSVRVRGARGTFRSVPFPKATYRQLVEAIRLLREARGPTMPELDDQTEARVARLLSALPEAPAGGGRGERIRFRKGSDGRMAVSFLDLPVEQLDEALATIRAHLLEE